jgi:adenine-specific DNA-methyltransferase
MLAMRKEYLFVLGEKEGKDIAIWREYLDSWNEVDFKRDKKFIIRTCIPTPIQFINGKVF